jgi:hypothetical protein
MKLASSTRPTTPQEGVAFIEQFIFPTLEICKRLEDEKKILAGGPVGGAIALALVIKAESIQELDELIGSLPIWPLGGVRNRSAYAWGAKPTVPQLHLGVPL